MTGVDLSICGHHVKQHRRFRAEARNERDPALVEAQREAQQRLRIGAFDSVPRAAPARCSGAAASVPGKAPPSQALAPGVEAWPRSVALSIERLLERRQADAANRIDEGLVRRKPEAEIGVDDGLDGVDDAVRGKARADQLADRAIFLGRSAERDLVVLDALAVDAQNADRRDVMMAAGIDAAGDLDRQGADLGLATRRAEPLRQALRDRDRAGIGERAIVETRAGDDVGDQPLIGGGEPGR